MPLWLATSPHRWTDIYDCTNDRHIAVQLALAQSYSSSSPFVLLVPSALDPYSKEHRPFVRIRPDWLIGYGIRALN